MENCQQLLLPSLQGGGGGGGGGDDVGNRSSLGEVELMSIDQCQKIPDMNDSQRADVAVNGVEVVEMSGGKRRRGRPPRNQARVVSSSSASTPQMKTQDEEEDVCFICFDGGSLVLCDRRGCPKAYHPACIKRDEAFFKSAAKWNCGWHICSTCQKASYYMCYTCTFSTCKKCTKDADYVNVRGNKGFCGLCMRMIMLIESTALGTKETVQVDFDDQNSWEYLFKVYWTLLKEKLSLSLAELIKAKNPWKEIASTERSFGGLGSSYFKRRKMMKQQIESLEAQKSGVMKGTLPEGKSRVSEEDTKEHALLLGMKEKEPASTLKGVDVLSDIESRESSVTPQPTEMELSVNNIETDIIWRYQDPHGKIQGPFSMETLRRWSVSGYFPPGLRIWRANERQENSILLTDALDGRYSPVQQVYHNSRVPTEDVRFAPNDGYQKRDGDVRESWDLNVDQTESKQVEERSKSMQNDASVHSCDINESAKSKESGSRSYCTAPVDIVTSNLVQTGNHVKGDNYFPGQPQVSSSLPSSSSSGKPCETQSHLVISVHGVDKRVCSSINMNENLNKTSESQIIAGNVKQDDSEGKSGKSCGQSWRSPLNDSSNGWDSNCGLISLVRALEASENNHYNDFPDLPTSTSGLNHEDSKPLGTKNEQSLSSSTLHQDSGPSWSTASSLVGNRPKLSEVAGECGRYSSVPAKSSAEEWDSDRVPESLKRTNLGSDLAATPTSGSGQLTHSSPTDAAEKASGWDSIILEPNEYSFGDESVSDLLAEVEAMESLNGVASPTSNLRCDGELAQGVELDFFSPVGGLSPALDPGKSDALSSTNDLRMPSQPTVSNEPIGVSQSEVLDAQKSSCGHSPSDVSVNQYEAGSDMQLPAPPSTTWGMTAIDTTWREVRETTGTNCEAIQGYPNFNLEGLGQGTRNIGWGTGQVTFQDNGRVNPGMYYGTQQRYLSPKGPDIQGRDSSSSRGRSSMHRHSTYGAPPLNAVGSFRPPPKGQRVCKFYERGDCKKGASCSYWHP